MHTLNIIFIVAGALAIVYGVLILWSRAVAQRGVTEDDWINSDEIHNSKYHNLRYLRHMLNPDQKTISTGRSKGRGYAMVAIGIVLIVFGIT